MWTKERSGGFGKNCKMRSFITCNFLPIKYNKSGLVEEDEMGGACSTIGE
jgi:hypothetical protein